MSPVKPRSKTPSRPAPQPAKARPAASRAGPATQKTSRPQPIPSINPASMPTNEKRRLSSKWRPVSKKRRTIIMSSLGAVLVAVAIWLTLPAFSLKYAASQSGVNATTPYFVPDEYSLQFPIRAQDSKVILTYLAKDKRSSFTISQEASLWDSQSVKLMVEKESEGRFLTTSDRGLTIYTYGGNAAWVNKGILYKIKGNNGLSGETLARIAGSF